jgi:hypothetical protein
MQPVYEFFVAFPFDSKFTDPIRNLSLENFMQLPWESVSPLRQDSNPESCGAVVGEYSKTRVGVLSCYSNRGFAITP